MKRAVNWFGSLVLAGAALGCGGTTTATAPVVADAPAGAASELPVDPAVRVGRLENGMAYYVRSNREPAKRAVLWLVVDAGSTQEQDDQQGLAHFVEHMAFNGTKRFEKQTIVDFMERIGMKFGPHVNAQTGFDETIYKLTVPTDSPDAVNTALDVLEDWASAISFEKEEVDKERGVVIEERRARAGAAMRLTEKILPLVVGADSKYAVRLPIGKEDILANAPVEALTRYYRDWYRPDLMAVIAVGDFDAIDMEAAIQKQFSDLEGPDVPRKREPVTIPDHEDTRIAVVTDAELPFTGAGIISKLPRQLDRTEDDYRRRLLESLYFTMLNARLAELTKQSDPPFMFASAQKQSFVRAKDAFIQLVATKAGQVERGLDAMLTELVRVERHGFTDTELERARANMLRGYRTAAAEKDNVPSMQYTEEILRHHLYGESMPGIDRELALAERLLPSVSVDELNTLAKSWQGEANRVIIVGGPSADAVPQQDGVLALFEAVKARTIDPYRDDVATTPLMAAKPVAGTIVGRKTIPELGVTEWKLSNGARVVLKPTEFKADEVLMVGVRRGGHSTVADADFPSARWASAIATAGGVGELDAVQLQKALAGKRAAAAAFIGELRESVNASGSPQDLETMFQLVHLRLTAPRKDPEAFGAWKSTMEETANNRLKNPETEFGDEMNRVLTGDHPRRRPVTKELLDQVSLDRAIELYRERFATVDGFTFVLVGRFDADKVEPLVTTYLASLPGGKPTRWKDVRVRRPKGTKRVEVSRGIEDKSVVRIEFIGDAKWTREAAHDLSSLAGVLRIRLREVLREEMGGVYGVGVGGGISDGPKDRYGFTISFSCKPDNVEALTKAVFDEIRSIKKQGVPDTYLDKVKEGQTRQRESAVELNGFWVGTLSGHYERGADPRLILKYPELVRRVTSSRVRQTATRYLVERRNVIGVMRPEASKQP